MWIYEKRLEYPVNIKRTNAQLAKVIISQYGGPDGELGASCVTSANAIACHILNFEPYSLILVQKGQNDTRP